MMTVIWQIMTHLSTVWIAWTALSQAQHQASHQQVVNHLSLLCQVKTMKNTSDVGMESQLSPSSPPISGDTSMMNLYKIG